MRGGDTGDTISTVSTPSSQVSMGREFNLWVDAPSNPQCGLHDNNVRNDFCDAQEAFETTASVDSTLLSLESSDTFDTPTRQLIMP